MLYKRHNHSFEMRDFGRKGTLCVRGIIIKGAHHLMINYGNNEFQLTLK